MVNSFLNFFIFHFILFLNLILILYEWSIIASQVVLVSGVQQSDSVMHMHIHILFQIAFP